MLGLPSYGGIDPRCVVALMGLASSLTHEKVPWSATLVFEDPDIANVHNRILQSFLDSDADRLLIVDNDVIFSTSDAMRLLLDRKEDFVGGDYRVKGGARMAGTPLPDGAWDGDLVEAAVMATGFLALSRHAVVMMGEHANPYEQDGRTVRAFMRTMPGGDGRWWSSDEVLCQRWRALGGKCWIDTSVKLQHVGTKIY